MRGQTPVNTPKHGTGMVSGSGHGSGSIFLFGLEAMRVFMRVCRCLGRW